MRLGKQQLIGKVPSLPRSMVSRMDSTSLADHGRSKDSQLPQLTKKARVNNQSKEDNKTHASLHKVTRN